MWFSKKTTGTWRTIVVADRPVRLFEPATVRHPFALLYLHDQDGATLEEWPAVKMLVEAWGCRVLCPQAGPTWWLESTGDELSPAAWVHGPVLEWIQTEWNLAPPRIALLGLGMGGQGVLRWGFTQADRFPVVVSLHASIAFEQLHGQGTMLDQRFASPEQARQHTAGMLIQPRHTPKSLALLAHRADPLWYRGNDRLHEKLQALGVEHYSNLTGLGDDSWWQTQWTFALQFIEGGMKATARRLL